MIFVSDHAFISKWWWIGVIRKIRRPQYLNDATWSITESASITKMPPTRSSSSSVFVITAKPASAPPIAIEPVSPMNTSAGKALNQRKPIAPPISAAPQIAMSSLLTSRSSAEPGLERMKAITLIAVKVKRAMIPVPAASPSRPSVRFTPFAAPAMIRKSSTYQPQPSPYQASTKGTKTARSCSRWKWCVSVPTAAVIATIQASFQRPASPSERRFVIFIRSSVKPIPAQPSVVNSTVSAAQV